MMECCEQNSREVLHEVVLCLVVHDVKEGLSSQRFATCEGMAPRTSGVSALRGYVDDSFSANVVSEPMIR